MLVSTSDKFESLPEEVKSILLTYDDQSHQIYQESNRIKRELKTHGYTAHFHLSGEISEIEKLDKVHFVVTQILDTKKQGSEIELNREFIGELSDDGKKVYYTDKADCQWVFWINETCKLL